MGTAVEEVRLLTFEGLKFGVRGTFTSGKRCSCRFAGTGRLNFVGRGLVIVSE